MTWAVPVIVVALLITLIAIATKKDVAYGLVIIWALAGIISKQVENQAVVLTGEAGIGIILTAIALMVVISRLKR